MSGEIVVELKRQIFKNDNSPITFDEKGRAIFTAKSINSDFIPDKWMATAAEDSPGKHLLYRHRDPNNPEHADEPIYGKVLESKVVNEEGKNWIISKYMIFDTTERSRSLAKAVDLRYREGKPLGISMAYHQYRNTDTNEIVGIHVLEHSVTWKPKCPLCVILEDENMVEEDKTKTAETPAKTESDEIIAKLDNKEIRLEALESDLDKKKKELEAVKEESKKRSDALELQKKMLESMKKDLDEIKAHAEYLETKKPIIDEIIKLEPADEMLKDVYATKDVKFLEDRRAKLKSRPAPEVKMAETAQETAKHEDVKITPENLKKWALEQGFTEDEIKKGLLI